MAEVQMATGMVEGTAVAAVMVAVVQPVFSAVVIADTALPNPASRKSTGISMHPTSGSRRVFRQFVWLEVGSVKVALPHPTHLRVTQAVGRLLKDNILYGSDAKTT